MGGLMSGFQRFAVYYLPEDRAVASFGAAWLGWDVETGAEVSGAPVHNMAAMVAKPRPYGFHATLKPPFYLAEGTCFDDLDRAVSDFATDRAPVQVDGLRLAWLDRFLALVPDGETQGLADLAFACVQTFDPFRRPASAVELARRRARGLTPRQEALLIRWGYPYVADAFRFHLTLTGPVPSDQRPQAEEALNAVLPALPRPWVVGSIALVGERADGLFRMIRRYRLRGNSGGNGSGGGI